MQLNGKLVYFLLAVLIALISWNGKTIADKQDKLHIMIDAIRHDVACLKTEFHDHIKYLHVAKLNNELD